MMTMMTMRTLLAGHLLQGHRLPDQLLGLYLAFRKPLLLPLLLLLLFSLQGLPLCDRLHTSSMEWT